MALEHAILVSLAERAASGYDLARRFDASIGHFWRASHQQIYKVLGRMETGGWIDSEVIEQGGRPDKKVYVLTPEGRTELLDWTGRPTPPEHLRSEFAVKLRALPFGDAEAIAADVARQRQMHADRLAYYADSAARFYPDPSAIADDDLGGWLVLRGGILAEEAAVTWCEEILAKLPPLAKEAACGRL